MYRCHVKYDDAEKFLREGDVLLFRRSGLVSRLIRSAGRSPYSHCGLVSICYDKTGDAQLIECLEFKEWIGSRAVSLRNYLNTFDGEIDVFSPSLYAVKTYWDCEAQKKVSKVVHFNGKKVTNQLRSMTGLPYGWYRIWDIFKRKTLYYFFPFNKEFDDDVQEELVAPVCSSAIAYCFTKCYVDLVHTKSDLFIEPGDVARSPILSYVFTLQK